MKYVFSKKEVVFINQKNPERTIYVYVDKECGAKNMCGGSCDIPVNSELTYHTHDKEEEIMFIYKGKGVLVIEGETEPVPIEPETMVFVPPGLKHLFRNTGSEPLSFAFFYSPGDPAQKIRERKKKQLEEATAAATGQEHAVKS